jgi:hypothetical protein
LANIREAIALWLEVEAEEAGVKRVETLELALYCPGFITMGAIGRDAGLTPEQFRHCSDGEGRAELEPLHWTLPVPLRVHGHYSRAEIEAACC